MSNQLLVYRLRPTRRQLFWELVTTPVITLALVGLIRLFGVPLDIKMAIALGVSYTSHSMLRIAARRHAAHLAELHEGHLVVSARDRTYEIPVGTLRSVRLKRLTLMAVFEGPEGSFLVDSTYVQLIEPKDPENGSLGMSRPSHDFIDLTRRLWDLNRGLSPANRLTDKTLRRYGAELAELSP
ncbi:hypothetical protein OG320_17200 [Microbispora sp. NBC_01189]|uniref:hypothetical protein n=1 Tax=Microbispora sp. NBC_01189 TaxID=2903583 RepID=UPI002E0E42C5|nr:hypothetical protein OG320_17200 [Microbispora sp. NBC_01189]